MLFKCLRSGNLVNIDQQDDIDRMKFHEGYIAVEVSTHSQGESHEMPIPQNAFPQAGEDAEAEVTAVAKKKGRPKKAEIVGEL